MSFYDYTVVPAPRRVKKVKGIGGGADLFAHALSEAINAMAHQGWEYVRSETMAAEETRGLFRRKVTAEHTVLVFCRPREVTDVRRLAREGATPLPPRNASRQEPTEATPAAERAVVERLQGALPRAEPRSESRTSLEAVSKEMSATPLRPSPRLGPAEKP